MKIGRQQQTTAALTPLKRRNAADVVRMKIFKGTNIYLHTEQTACPNCGNDAGNFVLLRSADHHHVVCGKCSRHYIVDKEFLAPFDAVQTVAMHE
jgi:DNA-directed RNA polymerase subunit M/transcription elongation factor TFIIS